VNQIERPSDEDIALAAQLACLLEVSAPKPGNVHRFRDFHDTRFEDFLVSAVAIGPAMRAARHVSVGETIWHAIRDTQRWVSTNTNLGIVLLLAPLAKACPRTAEGVSGAGWRSRLRQVLADLTVEDARLAYRAIRLAAPGGMGRVDQGDVAEDPELTLRAAMELARDRDAVAREYVTDFAITFELTCPALRQHLVDGLSLMDAIVQTYLTVLAEVPDTLITRKVGRSMAEKVSRRARDALSAGGVRSPAGRQAVEELDKFLADERHRLNPGTTADLVTAGLFVHILENGLQLPQTFTPPCEGGAGVG
jgi:triphosphoribosyl-dephospho-CoA synthase